jgi:hypothetical protein
VKQGLFEFYTSFQGMNVNAETINMCIIQEEAFDMVYINDSDGTMSPDSVITQTPSSLLASDNNVLSKFLDPSKCTDVPKGCYQYCTDTCFRSVRYSVTGPGQENYLLQVCQKNDHSKCSLFSGGRRGTGGSHAYIAHLPVGLEYDAVFINALGQEITPTTIVAQYETTSCSMASTFDVQLYPKMPPQQNPISAPVRAPAAIAPVKATAPVSVPVKAPIIPAPVSVPVKAPIIPAPVPTIVRPPVPIPAVSVPVPRPVAVPVRVNVPVPVTVPSTIRTPVASDVAQQPGVIGMKLIHAPTNQAVMDLINGTVVDVAQYPSSRFNVMAVILEGTTSETFVQSVQFSNGVVERTRPFSYCGNANGQYKRCSDLVSTTNAITITATPYNAAGTPLSKMTVTFRITDSGGV